MQADAQLAFINPNMLQVVQKVAVMYRCHLDLFLGYS